MLFSPLHHFPSFCLSFYPFGRARWSSFRVFSLRSSAPPPSPASLHPMFDSQSITSSVCVCVWVGGGALTSAGSPAHFLGSADQQRDGRLSKMRSISRRTNWLFWFWAPWTGGQPGGGVQLGALAPFVSFIRILTPQVTERQCQKMNGRRINCCFLGNRRGAQGTGWSD